RPSLKGLLGSGESPRVPAGRMRPRRKERETMRRLNHLAKRRPFAAREETMGKVRYVWVVGLAACVALPALAASLSVDDKNSKVTNTIGAQGEGQKNNGNGNAKFDSAKGIWEVNGGGDGLWDNAD